MQSDRPSLYSAIADYLVRQGESSVMLTDAEIEAMIGVRLRLGAVFNETWWTTSSLLHVRVWREFGWRALPDRAHRTVRFTRDAADKPPHREVNVVPGASQREIRPVPWWRRLFGLE